MRSGRTVDDRPARAGSGRGRLARLRTGGAELANRARDRSPALDHGVKAVRYYGEMLGGQLAASVTYYAFLSFFPIIALAFSIVGYVVQYVPDAADAVTDALNALLPGMVGTGPGQINVSQIASARTGAGIIGLLGLLYAGLGWITALRRALDRAFGLDLVTRHNAVVSKARDLAGLVMIGLGLIVAVGAVTVITGWADHVAAWLGLSHVPGHAFVLRLLALAVGIGTMAALFFATYRYLPGRRLPARGLWEGAFLAALGFEVLRQVASLVVRHVTDNALYGTFAVLVALLVWINYTAQLIMLGAAWAATEEAAEHAAELARSQSLREEYAEVFGDPGASEVSPASASRSSSSSTPALALKSAAVGAAGALATAVVGWRLVRLRRRRGRSGHGSRRS